MPAITALAPLPSPRDPMPAQLAGEGGDGFAPVLATRMPAGSARPGTPLPPSGKPVPTPATDAPTATEAPDAETAAPHRGPHPRTATAKPTPDTPAVALNPRPARFAPADQDPGSPDQETPGSLTTPDAAAILVASPEAPLPPVISTPPDQNGGPLAPSAVASPAGAPVAASIDQPAAADPTAPVLPTPLVQTTPPTQLPAPAAPPVVAGKTADMQPPARDEAARSTTEPAPAASAAASAGVVLPALQLFGAALHRAAVAERRAARREPDAAILAVGAAAPASATPLAEGKALDMTQSHWPDAMIARIEQLRNDANAADTRIRLHPDALGSIDVTLRQEGEAVHVRFTAAESATAKLLADAQPRLAELADARGLRLTQGGVDAGAQDRRERQQPTPTQTRTPRPAGEAQEPADADPDGRLA